ncbi:MAG: glycosyltransferase [Candidatus Hydrogenedentes bacterium]|nr:glycosyltransferase [Candidatus Hydrogenedentota bacterium]
MSPMEPAPGTSDSESPLPRFSLVIPAYNEEIWLPRLLDTLDVARNAYTGGPSAIEVIVADNASTDRTAEIARERGCKVAHVEKRAIAAARNGGAAMARGEYLCFVDADSLLDPDTFNAIDRGLAKPNVIAGATGVRMERMSPGIALAYCMLLPLVWLMRMDTGVIFCRREDFHSVGGYNEGKLFAEDLEFMFALRRLGKSRGQRLLRLRAARAVTSTRKWDKHGEWHYIRILFGGALALILGKDIQERIARPYWYDDPR